MKEDNRQKLINRPDFVKNIKCIRYKKDETENLSQIFLNVLLDFYPLILSSFSLFSVFFYFLYFGISVKYFPSLSGSDVFYFGGLILSISLVISFFFYIFPSICYPSYHNNKSIISLTNIGFVISILIPLSFSSYLTFFYLALLIIDYNKILLDIRFSVGISFVYILCWMAIEKKELIGFIIIVPFSLAVPCLAYCIYKFFSINNIDEVYLNILLFFYHQ